MKKALLFLIFAGNVFFPSQTLEAGGVPKLLRQVIQGLQNSDNFLPRLLKILEFEIEIEDINNARLEAALRDLTPKKALQLETLLSEKEQDIFPTLKKTPRGPYILERIQEQLIKDWIEDGAPSNRAEWFLRWWSITQGGNINDLRLFEQQWFEEKGLRITTDLLFKYLQGKENTLSIYSDPVDDFLGEWAEKWDLDEIQERAREAYILASRPSNPAKWLQDWLSKTKDMPSYSTLTKHFKEIREEDFRIADFLGVSRIPTRTFSQDINVDEIQERAREAYILAGSPSNPTKWLRDWLSETKDTPSYSTFIKRFKEIREEDFRLADFLGVSRIRTHTSSQDINVDEIQERAREAYILAGSPRNASGWLIKWLSETKDTPSYSTFIKRFKETREEDFRLADFLGVSRIRTHTSSQDINVDEIQERAREAYILAGSPRNASGWLIKWLSETKDTPSYKTLINRFKETREEDFRLADFLGDSRIPTRTFSQDINVDEIQERAREAYILAGSPRNASGWLIKWLSETKDTPSYSTFIKRFKETREEDFRLADFLGDSRIPTRTFSQDINVDEIQERAREAYILAGSPRNPAKWLQDWLSKTKGMPSYKTLINRFKETREEDFRLADFLGDSRIPTRTFSQDINVDEIQERAREAYILAGSPRNPAKWLQDWLSKTKGMPSYSTFIKRFKETREEDFRLADFLGDSRIRTHTSSQDINVDEIQERAREAYILAGSPSNPTKWLRDWLSETKDMPSYSTFIKRFKETREEDFRLADFLGDSRR